MSLESPKYPRPFGFTNTSNHILGGQKKKKKGAGIGRGGHPGIILQTGVLPCLTERKLDGMKGLKGDKQGMTTGQLQLPCECCTLLDDKELYLRSLK